jgi:purine-nucleoside phosphorylase
VTGRPGPGDTLPEQALALIRERSDVHPAVAMVLGSGLGDAVVGDVRVEQEFAYEGLPGFPPPSVPGHAGRLILGELYGVPAAIFRGRVHYYEGHGIGPTTLIPRLTAALGAGTLVLTNAAGGLDPSMRAGHLMLIEDHLNFIGVNPLMGWRLPDGAPAFVPLSGVYDRRLLELAEEAARHAGLHVRRGTYVALPGPSYETPAETRFLSTAGAQAVGMSTVPEAVAAAALGLSVLGISAITNVAGSAGNHEEVLAAARRTAEDLRRILAAVVPRAAGQARGSPRPATVTTPGGPGPLDAGADSEGT